MNIKFRSIRFKNILSYGNSITEFNFTSGLNLISALNGSGKSTLNDVICFALYGKPYRSIVISDLINNRNNKNLWVEITFDQNDDIYRIERGIKPSVLKIFKNDEEIELESSKGLIQDYLETVIGCNYNLFKQIISLSILNNKPFLTLDSLEKKNILESIFNIKVFGKMLKQLKKNHSLTKNTLELNEKEISLMKENLESLVSQIKSLDKLKNEFEENKEKDLKSYELKLQTLQNDFTSIERKLEGLKFIEKTFDETVKKSLKESKEKYAKLWMQQFNQINSKNSYINELDNSDIDDLANEIRELRELLSSLLKEIEIVKIGAETKKKNSDKHFQDEKIRINKEIQYSEYNIEKLNTEKSLLNKKYLEKNLSQVLEKKKSLTENIIKISSLNEEIGKLQTDEGSCTYCQQIVSIEHRLKETALRKENIQSLEIDNKLIEAEIDNIISNHIREQTNNIEINLKKLEDMISKSKESLLNEESKFKLKHTAIQSDLKTSLDEFEEKKVEITVGYIDSLKASIRLEIKELEKTFESTKEESKKIEDSLNKLELDEKEYIQKKNDHINLMIQSDSVNIQMNGVYESIDKLKEKTFTVDVEDLKKTFEGKKKNYQELKSKIDDLKNKIKVEKAVEECLSEEGIKRFFFSKLIPKLNESINQYLNFFDLPLRFSFNDMFEETILEVGNIERSFKSFSGGEQFRISLALILSFQDLNRLINNFHPNIVVFDELLDVGGDHEVVESVLEKLKEITDKNNMCSYIISHRSISESPFIDKVIEIKKEKGFSRILA